MVQNKAIYNNIDECDLLISAILGAWTIPDPDDKVTPLR